MKAAVTVTEPYIAGTLSPASKKCQKVADFFISLANETGNFISNLQLQKLVYYSQAWHLVKTGRSLFREEFEAWVHGPVIPELFDRYQKFYGFAIVREDLVEGSHDKIREQFSTKTLKVLDLVTEEYFWLTTYHLEIVSTGESPWLKARKGLCSDDTTRNKIQRDDMVRFYKKLWNEKRG